MVFVRVSKLLRLPVFILHNHGVCYIYGEHSLKDQLNDLATKI